MIANLSPIPAFRDNYIWAFTDADGREACIVDPGDSEPVLAWLRDRNLVLTAILITHHHQDHTGGLPRLRNEFSPRIFGPATGPTTGIDTPLGDQEKFDLFGESFEVMTVPGHTLDHIAYFVRNPNGGHAPILFCGDTLFAAGCGRIFEGDPDMMYRSLQKLAALHPDTRVYCTHEYTLANLRFAAAADPDNSAVKARIDRVNQLRAADQPSLPSVLAEELSTNPFLRCDQPALQASAQRHAGQPVPTPALVFSALRAWKDHF